jgi:hypothetical protein
MTNRYATNLVRMVREGEGIGLFFCAVESIFDNGLAYMHPIHLAL